MRNCIINEMVFGLCLQVEEAEESGKAMGAPGTATELLQGIYKACLSEGEFSCVKPKVLAFLSASVSQDKVRISRDLSIVRRQDAPIEAHQVI